MARMRLEDLDIANADIYRRLLYHLPDIVHCVDKDGNLIYANCRAQELLGYSADELLTKNLRDLYPEDILSSMAPGFEELPPAGGTRVKRVFLSRDGQRIPVEMRSFSVYDDKGQFVHSFTISRDLRSIKRLQNELIHAARLAAVGEMASGIAHDINNPLQVISLSAQLLQNLLDDRAKGETREEVDEARQIGKDIHRAAESIENLSKQLFDFSQKSTESYVSVDLRQVVEEALFMTQHRRNKAGVGTREELGSQPAQVRGSENQLEQVFINLISNACDAMAGQEGERRLTVRVEARQEDSSLFWSCQVSDNGPGVPDEVLSQIFKSFFTTKEGGEGTGLGLSIARGIIENHRGRIVVNSSPGEGTSFTVLLPAAGEVVA